jgi:hypothetical protein
MDVSGLIHAPAALLPGKEPAVPIGEEAGWAPEPIWTLKGKENLVLKGKSNSGRLARSYIDRRGLCDKQLNLSVNYVNEGERGSVVVKASPDEVDFFKFT